MITIQDIKKEYKKVFYLEDDFVIDLMTATVISTYLKCDNIWTLVVGPSSGGKCFGPETEILMFNGTTKQAKNIMVGDLLMGDDSTPRKVLETHSGTDTMYNIKQQTGDSYTVNGEHILCLRDKDRIEEISVKDYLNKSNNFKNIFKGYRVGVEFPKKEVTIDPYYLGLWLGDGRRDSTSISKPDIEVEQYIQKYAKKLSMRMSKYVDQRGNYCPELAIVKKNINVREKNPLELLMVEYGLMPSKFIPTDYKRNTRKIRFEILAGLLDTDGYLDKKKNCYEFVSKDKRLAEDVTDVARSLGLSSYCHQTQKGIKSIGFIGTYYRVSISGDIWNIPTKIPRKQAIKKIRTKDILKNGIEVIKTNKGKYYGFETDGNHRFLLKDFTVVHNSELINIFFKLKFVHQISDMTENTLLSGMATGDTEASFLNRMGPLGCIAMKDFTSILSMRQEKASIIMGQLREVYDGYIEKKTGNGRNPKWVGKATFIGGVTEAVYNSSDESASMGRRNILYVLPPQDRKKTARMSQANKSDGNKKAKIEEIQEMVRDYVNEQVCALPEILPIIKDDVVDKLIDLADFSTHARTPTTRNYKGTMTLVTSLEMPMRMLDQLVALAQVFTIMYGGELTEQCVKGLFKIALDSIPKQKRLSLRELATYETVTTKSLAVTLGYETDVARMWLQDLGVLGLVNRLPPASIGEPDRWQLKDDYKKLMIEYDGIIVKNEALTVDSDYYSEESEELDPGLALEIRDRNENGDPFAGSIW